MTLPPDIAAAVAEFSSSIRARFGARLRELVLFGSYARGEARSESDVDVCVVVDGLTPAEDREIGDLMGSVLTKHEVLISALAMSTEHMRFLRGRELLIADEISRDGIPL